MEYFKDLNAQVFYCDSSEIAYDDTLSPNIRYLHLPGKKFAEKILIALHSINTDLVALCADDDFILIDSLYKGADFLSKNNDFSTIIGKYFGFKEEFDGIYAKNPNSFRDINFSAEENARVFFTNYYQILWAMYRKNTLETAFTIIKQAKFSNDNFIELIIGAVVCYSGGIRFLNDIWGIREISASDHWGKRHLSISEMDIINREKDFIPIRTQLDQYTSDGYSDLVLNSYLHFTRKKDVTIRTMLKKIIPRQFLTSISKLKHKAALNDSPDIITEEEHAKLHEITKVIEKHCQRIN